MTVPTTGKQGPFGRRALLAGLAAPALTSGFSRAQAQTSGLTVVGKDGWLFPLWDNVRRLDMAQLQAATQAINGAVGLFKAAKIDVAIALLPSKARLYRRFLPADMQVAPEADKRYGAALAELRKPGTLAPDLDSVFLKLRDAPNAEPLYFKTDTHWTPTGAEAAAAAMAQEIKAKIALPASGRPGSRLGQAASLTHPPGDLVRWVPPADKAKYVAEPYKKTDVAASGGGLLEDDAADVAVIGNSFMEPRYGFQSYLSAQLNRPVSLFWKTNNIGVYTTLLNYVASDAFKKQRPKLVVVGFLELDMTSPPNNSSWGQNAMPTDAFLSGLRSALA